MGVKVTVGSNSNRVVTSTPSNITARPATVITSQSKTSSTQSLSGLTGVDTSGVQNGYTLVYDSTTGNWEAAPASSFASSVTAIDGGTF